MGLQRMTNDWATNHFPPQRLGACLAWEGISNRNHPYFFLIFIEVWLMYAIIYDWCKTQWFTIFKNYTLFIVTMGFPGGSAVKNSPTIQRHGFDTWVGKIPWRRKWQPTPVFLPGESHGQRSLVGYSPRIAKSRTRLSDFTFTFYVT